jgi:hypothetical protein
MTQFPSIIQIFSLKAISQSNRWAGRAGFILEQSGRPIICSWLYFVLLFLFISLPMRCECVRIGKFEDFAPIRERNSKNERKLASNLFALNLCTYNAVTNRRERDFRQFNSTPDSDNCHKHEPWFLRHCNISSDQRAYCFWGRVSGSEPGRCIHDNKDSYIDYRRFY